MITEALRDVSDIPDFDVASQERVVLRLCAGKTRPRFWKSPIKIAASLALLVGFTTFAASLGMFSSFRRALSGAGGSLRLSGEVSTAFVPTALNRDWYPCEPKGGSGPNEKGVYSSAIGVGDTQVDVTAQFDAQKDGSLIATYVFVPRKDVDLRALCIHAMLPLSQYVGADILSDGLVRATVPEKSDKLVLYNEQARSFRLRPVSEGSGLSLSFQEPVRCFCQDNRTFGKDSLTLRIFAAGKMDGDRYLAQEKYVVRFQMAGPISFEAGHPVKIVSGEGWVPVSFSGRVLAGSALDFSTLRPSGRTVGEQGRVVVRDGRFEFANCPNKPQRFWGVNLNFSSTIPPESESEQIAERLARLGYNSIRLHHHDGVIVRKAFDGVTLDDENMRKMDALVSACSRHGIYVSTDLFVSRTKVGIPYRAVGIDADGRIEQMEYKELLPFHAGVANDFFEFVRAFLGHVNAFTGIRYADDPTIAFLSLVNENEFGNFGTKYFVRHEFMQRAWTDWLTERSKSDPKTYGKILSAAHRSTDVLRGFPDAPMARAFMQFVSEAERQFVNKAKAVIRDELKCNALITDCNGWNNRIAYQPMRAECLDYVDTHYYVDHPTFSQKDGKCPREMREKGENPIQNGMLAATGFAPMRIFGKPFVLTEFNYCAPGRFRALGNLAFGSMAALQDWSGLWRFTYGHDARQLANPAMSAAIGSFNGASDPVSIAADKMMFALFLRGDLSPLSNGVGVLLKPSSQTPLPVAAYKRLSWDWISWYFRTGTSIGDSLPADVRPLDVASDLQCTSQALRKSLIPGWKSGGYVPPAGDGAVVLDPMHGAITVSTTSCAGGFAEHGYIFTPAVTAELSGGAAGVWAISLDGHTIAKSGRLLVAHVTDAQNADTVFADGTMSVMLNKGHSPMLMRSGRADITLACEGASASVYALGDDGRRMRTVPSRLTGGRLAFTADVAANPASASCFYEITVAPAARKENRK